MRRSFLLCILSLGLSMASLGADVAQEWQIPNPASRYTFCRPGEAVFSVAHCINRIAAEKRTQPLSYWRISILPGVYELKEALLLWNVSRLEIRGPAERSGKTVQLRASGLPQDRLTHQFFSVLVMNSSSISINNLRLDGMDRTAQRGIVVCSTPGKVTRDLLFSKLEMQNFTLFNVIVGNTPEQKHFNDISRDRLKTEVGPARDFANFVHAIPPTARYCGGEIHNLNFLSNQVYMKTVGFYLAPPSGLATANISMDEPDANTANPRWYAASDLNSRKVTGLTVAYNRFLNVLTDSEMAKANQYHSAIKLHWAEGTRITYNLIDGAGLPAAFSRGGAINIAAGMVNTLVEGNQIILPPGLTLPFGISVLSSYLEHSDYGFGKKRVFGATKQLAIRNNSFTNSVIQFMDCCIQEKSGAPDMRGYCRQRDYLIQRKLLRENIEVKSNLNNGLRRRDAELVWRVSDYRADWVADLAEQELDGNGGIACRTDLKIAH